MDCEVNTLTFNFIWVFTPRFVFPRSSSLVCNAQSSHVGHESIPSLPGLACHGWRDRPGLAAPSSPFPLLTGLGFLLDTIMGLHKGLSSKAGFHAPSHTPVSYELFCCFFSSQIKTLICVLLPPPGDGYFYSLSIFNLSASLTLPSSLVSCCQNP